MVLVDAVQKTFRAGGGAIDFSLSGVDGKKYSLKSFASAKALVVVFTCNHCPYAQAFLPRLIKIQRDYASKNVQLIGINPNDAKAYPEDSFESMKTFAKERGINFPYLRDETQEVAKKYGAVCTPDIFVFDEARKLVYRGKVDNSSPYDNPETATKHFLQEAIDAALKGKAPEVAFERVIGCSIKWKKGNAPQ